MAPTSTTEIPSPPRILPNILPIVSNSCSAIWLRSSITPMKMNSGTATSTSFVIKPMYRLGKDPKLDGSNTPKAMPTPQNSNEVPARVKATGKPRSRKPMTPKNISAASISPIMIGSIRRLPRWWRV